MEIGIQKPGWRFLAMPRRNAGRIFCAALAALLYLAPSPAFSGTSGGAASSPKPAAQPLPPAFESSIGYLNVLADTSAAPRMKKIFILPQVNLAVLSEEVDAYYLIFSKGGLSNLCRIPKYARFTVLMHFSENKDSLYLRGAVEADAAAFPLYAGEELPVLEIGDDGWTVAVNRNKRDYHVLVPLKTENVTFDKESRFAKFAAEQRKKGLELHDGAWLPVDDAAKLREDKARKRARDQARWEELNSAAAKGYIVLKDGTVLRGVKKGGDNTRVYFGTETKDYSLSAEDVADMDPDDMAFCGYVDEARKLFRKAAETEADNPGDSIRFSERALSVLEQVDDKTSQFKPQAVKLAGEISGFMARIQKNLTENGLVIYSYTVFPRKILDYHLEKGHILLQRKFWVEPAQVCQACGGQGKVMCTGCSGLGTVRVKCAACANGAIPCHICKGKGAKKCYFCKGAGSYMRTCPTCGGSGSVVNYSSYGGPACDSSVYVGGRGQFIYTNYWPWWGWGGGTSIDKCPVCDGGGYVRRPCFNCGGDGLVPCPKTEKCKVCRGLGLIVENCSVCQGTKKMSCADCGGRGYKGEPAAYEPGGPQPELKTVPDGRPAEMTP